MIHTNRFIALSCVVASVFATSCVNEIEEGLTSVNGEGYYISLTGEVNKGGAESRAHWDINKDGNQTLAFAWDQSQDEMKSFVRRGDAFVDFDGGQKYSATTVTPNEADNNQAQLQITTSLSQAYAENDVIWAVSPLKDTDISADNKVIFTLPDQFVQTELNSTEHLKQYVLMSGTGTVDGNNSASISFNVLPAIYRFKIINSENEELTVNEVSISGPFCNQAVLEYGKAPVYSVSNNGTYTIKVATPAGGLEVAAGATAYLYALVFPTNTASISDNITLSFKGKYGDTPVEDYIKTAPCNSIYKENLDPNTYNDLEVPVSKPDYSDIFSFTDDANLKSLGYGQSYQIKYTNKDATIKWSSNSDIVSVDSNGMLKVNTLVGGDATITASVTKEGVSFTKTVDVTVAKGRFDCVFDNGLIPWYRESANPGVSETSDGTKTTIGMKFTDPKYRADLQFVKDKETYLDAKNYPIFAIKLALPTYEERTSNDTKGGNVTFEVLSEGLGGNHDNKENSYLFVNDQNPSDGEIAYIYYDLSNKYNFGPSEKRLSLSKEGPTKIDRLTFKIADFTQIETTTYDIYWVKTFASVEELQSFVNSETASK